MFRRFTLVAFLFSQLLLSTAFAQDKPAVVKKTTGTRAPAIIVGAQFGWHIFESEETFLGSNLINHPTLGLRLGYAVIPHLDIEAAFNYVPTRASATDVSHFNYFASLVGNLYHQHSWTPYLSVGFGGMTLDTSIVNSTQNDTAIAYAAGLKFFVTDDVAFRLEVRGMTALDTVRTNADLTAGFVSYFPWERDNDWDKDGVPNKEDKCPREAGLKENGGCPVYDKDKDGIPDDKDLCPDQPEDIDNFMDDDGCPDLDNDGDGIADAADKCPNDQETLNGFQDDDGCPDEVPAPTPTPAPVPSLDKFTGVMRGIKFAFNSAIIDLVSFPLLNEAAEAMKANPENVLIIEGHTDNVGSKSYNLHLSRERSEAVRQYMISRGVSPFAIRIAPYGESRPIASNNTETGRALNRRIEFRFEKLPTKSN